MLSSFVYASPISQLLTGYVVSQLSNIRLCACTSVCVCVFIRVSIYICTEWMLMLADCRSASVALRQVVCGALEDSSSRLVVRAAHHV